MGRITVGVNVGGLPEVKAAYEDFKDSYINRLVKSGAIKAGRKTVPAVKAATNPSTRTGMLEKARGYKYKLYRLNNVWVVLVGAREGFRRYIHPWGVVDPLKYDHLLEGGRKAVRPKKADWLTLRFKKFPKFGMRKRGKARVRVIIKYQGYYLLFAKYAGKVKGRKPVAKQEPTFALNALMEIPAEIRAGIPKILAKYGNKVYK